jgi:hypothetical protein
VLNDGLFPGPRLKELRGSLSRASREEQETDQAHNRPAQNKTYQVDSDEHHILPFHLVGTGTAEGPGTVEEKAIRDGQTERDDMGQVWAETPAHELTEDGNEDRRADGSHRAELQELEQNRSTQDAPPQRGLQQCGACIRAIQAVTAQCARLGEFYIRN